MMRSELSRTADPAAATQTPLLTVSDLWVSFSDSRDDAVVKGVSFELHRGETLALVGESGSGKSVTALSILQLLNPDQARLQSGHIQLGKTSLMGQPESVLRQVRGNRASMIFQEPMTSLNPLHTIEKQINEVLLVHKGMNQKQARERTLELLSLVGLDNVASRLNAYPHELSGGQRQRVMIAMALANEPDLLIADEPTTALDVTVQAQILHLLRELQARLGLAILLITHDLTVVQHVAHRVCVMRAGEIREAGPTEKVFSHPQDSYTQALLAAEPAGRVVAEAPSGSPILQAESVRVWFPIKSGLLQRTVDHVKAVDDVSLQLHAGETLGVVGESGSGKTTLALALLRLIPCTGTIVFQGRGIDSLKGKALKPLRQQLQVVFQDPYGSLSPRMSVAQIVLEGLRAHGRLGDNASNDAKVIDVLQQVGLEPDSRHRYPHEFSGGQRQRIAIARALILQPALIMLDEPTSALDRAVQVQMIDLLRDLQARHGLAYLFISHDLKVVRALAGRLIVMRAGQVVEAGDTESVFERPQHRYTRELMSAAFTGRVGDAVS